jgi:hypothetical protein
MGILRSGTAPKPWPGGELNKKTTTCVELSACARIDSLLVTGSCNTRLDQHLASNVTNRRSVVIPTACLFILFHLRMHPNKIAQFLRSPFI